MVLNMSGKSQIWILVVVLQVYYKKELMAHMRLIGNRVAQVVKEDQDAFHGRTTLMLEKAIQIVIYVRHQCHAMAIEIEL
jgi:hypothetical protein